MLSRGAFDGDEQLAREVGTPAVISSTATTTLDLSLLGPRAAVVGAPLAGREREREDVC